MSLAITNNIFIYMTNDRGYLPQMGLLQKVITQELNWENQSMEAIQSVYRCKQDLIH